MDCDRVQHLLNGYVDGELDLVNSLDIEEHLRNCTDCSREYQSLTALHTLTSDPALYHTTPAGLEKRIRDSLQQAERPASTRSIFSWPWLAPAAVLAVILLLAIGFFGFTLLKANQDVQLAQQVQTAHVRSLMANHLTDVASSNQHTVKPWFNGKVDFSPPVVDLSAQGYPLVGGRLDYLDNRPVAALVYRSNQHIINLFIWPSTEKVQGLQSSSYNGYHVFHWTQSGMTYWAVSDLNVQELQDFVRLVQKNFQ